MISPDYCTVYPVEIPDAPEQTIEVLSSAILFHLGWMREFLAQEISVAEVNKQKTWWFLEQAVTNKDYLIPQERRYKHTEAEINEYEQHAEAFYQLMCTVHGSASLTGYMLKLVDVVPHLLRLLPFNLGRGSTEGSESLHHFRTKDYFW